MVLVIGTRGFIGSNVARGLSSRGFDVRRVSRSPIELERSDHFFVDDLEVPGALDNYLSELKPDFVVNAAGAISQTGMMPSALRDDLISKNIAESLLKHSPDSVLVHIGSAAEYGFSARAFAEIDEPKPTSYYGRNKLQSTSALERKFVESDSTCLVLRAATVYGPGQVSAMLIPTVFRHLRELEPLKLFRPSSKRDYLYIEDLTEFISQRILNPIRKNFDILNIGTGLTTKTIEAVRLILELIDEPNLRHLVEYAESDSSAVEESLILNVDKIRDEYGFSTSFDLRSGLKKMLEDVRSD